MAKIAADGAVIAVAMIVLSTKGVGATTGVTDLAIIYRMICGENRSGWVS